MRRRKKNERENGNFSAMAAEEKKQLRGGKG